MLDRYWRLLGETWPLAMPRAHLREEIGTDALAWLEATRMVHGVPFVARSSYPCLTAAEPGCRMRILQERGALVAVCSVAPAECDDEPLVAPDNVRVHVSCETLVPLLQRSLRLEQRWEAGLELIHLGERRFGTTAVRFVLVPRPDSPIARNELDQAARADPDRIFVALAFHRRDLPASPPVEGRRVQWLAFGDTRPIADGLAFDLTGLWDAFAPNEDPGTEVWPRYLFVADPLRASYRYAGQSFGLAHRPQVQRLLIELLRRPGEWLSRQELLPLVWPEEYQGPDAVQIPAIEKRLRTAVSELRGILSGLDLPAGVDPDPLENVRSASDTDGGYRLDVRPSSIRWLSYPR